MNKLPFAIIGLAVIILAFFLFRESIQEEEVAQNSYANRTYGISFSYPEGYVLTEEEQGDLEHEQYVITLTRTEDATPPKDGEGPTGITIAIHQNDTSQEPLLGWLTHADVSNWKLSDHLYASTTVGGVEAVHYRWSGLYEGETTAFIYADTIITVTATRLAPDDHAAAYQQVLATMDLQ